MGNLEIKGTTLARNTLLNLIGQTITLIVGVIAIPFIIRGLGTERFGLLSLVWVILGYFALFDLGLGRATTKFVAEALGKGEKGQVPILVWTSVTIQVILGLLGTLVLLGITSFLVEHILNIPLELHHEARITFYLLAFSVPIVLITSSFQGVLEAAQRFDLINAIKIPFSILIYLLPLLGTLLNLSLPGIVVLILLMKLGALAAFLLLNFRIAPEVKKYSKSHSLFPHLFAFGGWITVSNLIGPILQYMDRFLIGALLTMSAVTYYTAPFDVITRLWIIPGSFMMTLFPTFSALGLAHKEELRYLYVRTTKYVILAVAPVVLFLILFAQDIFRFWLGTDFARNSTLVFQILALGALIGAITHLSLTLFQGIGYPDITAKVQLLLLPVAFLLAWILINKMGIIGAALAWTLIRTLGMVWTSVIAWRLIHLKLKNLIEAKIVGGFLWILLFMALSFCLLLINNILLKISFTLILYFAFTVIGWYRVLDTVDKQIIFTIFKRPQKSENKIAMPIANY